MPFGLKEAPRTFQRMMDQFLCGLDYCVTLAYLDDIIVYGATVEESLVNLRLVFQRIAQANLKLKPKKCSLFQRETLYLGHIISDDGVRCEPEKVQAVKEWKPPRTLRQGMSFMGLVNYYASFRLSGLKDASIIHLYKRKGNRSQCDNHRGISLLSIAGKILARVVLNRLTTEVIDKVYPESQCGFRSGRGTADMVFAYRQLQEKCNEQNQPLYTVFVDLTKAFDTVSRDGLWKLLHKIGCPQRITNIIRAFHDGMKGRVYDNGNFSEPFSISNGAKQGCVLAPTLFGIVFALMLQYAFRELDLGVYLQVRFDGGVFNLTRFSARTKITETYCMLTTARYPHTASNISRL